MSAALVYGPAPGWPTTHPRTAVPSVRCAECGYEMSLGRGLGAHAGSAACTTRAIGYRLEQRGLVQLVAHAGRNGRSSKRERAVAELLQHLGAEVVEGKRYDDGVLAEPRHKDAWWVPAWVGAVMAVRYRRHPRTCTVAKAIAIDLAPAFRACLADAELRNALEALTRLQQHPERDVDETLRNAGV